jgi:hypothetical protein
MPDAPALPERRARLFSYVVYLPLIEEALFGNLAAFDCV